jgi:acetyltransferase-like isoleucine patch superfamily enzyme
MRWFGPGSYWENVEAVLRARWYLRNANYVGARVRVWGQPKIRNGGTIRIGNRTQLISHTWTLELSASSGATLDIGDRVFINYGSTLGATKLIRIGPRCAIGSHAIIIDNDFHTIDPERRYDVPASAPIIIEENVWLGARVIVLRGVTIGAHSVIGAGSVVTRNIPPRSVAVGLPARVVKSI